MNDPTIRQVLKEMQENPKAAMESIQKSPYISESVNKLVAAGIIKMGSAPPGGK